MLDWAGGAGLGVNVEIKHDVPSRVAVARAVAAELAAFPRVEIVVSSFDPWILALHRALSPGRCHAELIHESTYHDVALPLSRALRFDGVHVERSIATPARIGPCIATRFAAVWTIGDPVDARRLAALGVSGLITDTPGLIAAALTRE